MANTGLVSDLGLDVISVTSTVAFPTWDQKYRLELAGPKGMNNVYHKRISYRQE